MRLCLLSAAFIFMGFTMPSCPGQEAMQQQIVGLETSKLDLTKKVASLNAQVATLNKDLGEVRQVLVQMSTVIQAQKGALEQMENTLKNLKGKPKTQSKPQSLKKR